MQTPLILEILRNPKFSCPVAGHVIIGNLKIISDSRIHSVIFKGPKYGFRSRIDFKKYRKEIPAALNDFSPLV